VVQGVCRYHAVRLAPHLLDGVYVVKQRVCACAPTQVCRDPLPTHLSHDGGFAVWPQAQPIHHACCQGHNVLQGAAHLRTRHIRQQADHKVIGGKQLLQHLGRQGSSKSEVQGGASMGLLNAAHIVPIPAASVEPQQQGM